MHAYPISAIHKPRNARDILDKRVESAKPPKAIRMPKYNRDGIIAFDNMFIDTPVKKILN